MGWGRYWRTVRHLRPVQIHGRVRFRLLRPAPDRRAAPPLRARARDWVAPVPARSRLLGPARIELLGAPADIAAPGIWNDRGRDRLWRYHLHYFDALAGPEARVRRDWHRALIARWIGENPPAGGTGWEPYPVSLRLANWVKWHLGVEPLGSEPLASAAVQARWLRRRLEWHLQGNHLLANAKALIFAGCLFAGPEGETWLREGIALMDAQLVEQVLPDGGHFERSPMYQSILTEDLLDTINVARAYGVALPAAWNDTARAMLRWLGAMCHPDGAVALFNDATLSGGPPPAALYDYAARLGLEAPPAGPGPGITSLEASGYARVELGETVMFVDRAPLGPDYLPAHGHADTLTFELSRAGRRMVVDSGTSTYAVGTQRSAERGTAAHNTLVVDGADSSEVWSAFRVGRRARVSGCSTAPSTDTELVLRAAHDGYRHLPGAPVHSRCWRLTGTALMVTDTLSGGGTHRVAAHLHLHPEVEAFPDGAAAFELRRRGGERLARLSLRGFGAVSLRPACYHPEFGASVETLDVVGDWEGRLPAVFETCISWG